MSSLDNIRAFVRAVELGSFSETGRSMRLSAAVVSHRIRSLERQLGCRLFIRTTRKMHLTEQGRVYYENCLEVIRALERAEASVAAKGAAPPGMLKVTSPLGFGRRVVAPMLPKFQRAHPEINVILRLSDHLLDLFTEAVDVAVRLAVLPDSSLVVRQIAHVERTLCASPEYLARRGTPRSIADLALHACLMLRFPGSKLWTLQKGSRAVAVPVSGPLDTDDGDVLTAWALAGEGIALRPVFEIAEHFRSGALVRVLGEHPPVPATLAILHGYQRLVPPKVRDFADMMIIESRQHIKDALARLEPVRPRGAARSHGIRPRGSDT
jgi:DNA-binding transcriptional LysR family regulator